MNEKCLEILQDQIQLVAHLPAREEESAVTIRTLSHTLLRLAGDTDHWTKLEAGPKNGKQKRVRSTETAGGGNRANRGS